MYNFENLNDVEFEYLCKDIMEKMLNVKLQRFGSGQDGGIDLTDDVSRKNIIIQVKHYAKTSISGLLVSLRKEVQKVEKHKPKQYYVCCSKQLTPKNKQDIYTLFSDYMESTDNIITLIEISDFLDQLENADIVWKHYKLWLESTNVLTDIFTNDICIDSATILHDIKESVCMFVKTSAFEQACSCLEKNNALIIIGNPGVGKTITSKMLILYYVSLGYRIRYTTDGSDLAAIKRALSKSPDTKEIVLLDDCFGQAYFSMKETQENELLLLIRHIKSHPNKLLIMNSRVTIYQEAKERTPNLVKSLDCKEYKVYVLDMDNISVVEKAKIFYNHLYFCGVPQKYRDDIIKNLNYRKIVKHPNYNPRIIEFVCNPRQFEMIESNQYSEFIIQCLNNPEQVWKNEYERRLANIDRILLTTLYSLTNTTIPMQLVKTCYEYRILRTQAIDLSINHFEQSVGRLMNSMLKIIDVTGIKMLSVANPSVNDFICAHLERNVPEKKMIIETSNSARQLKRLLSVEDYDIELKRRFIDKTILTYVFEDKRQKNDFIAYYCAEYKVFDVEYKQYLENFIHDMHAIDIYENRRIPLKSIFKKIFDKDVCLFYDLGSIICDLSILKHILKKLSLKELAEFIECVDDLFLGNQRKSYIMMTEISIKEKIEDYCYAVFADDFDVDVGKIIDNSLYEDEYGNYIDTDAAISAIDDDIIESIIDEIDVIISNLPMDILIDEEFVKNIDINVEGSETLVENYLKDEQYDGYNWHLENVWDDDEIDYIFKR